MQVPSAAMVSFASEMSNEMWHNEVSILYGFPAILSMLFATVLMMIDFIIPCVTHKKVINLIIN